MSFVLIIWTVTFTVCFVFLFGLSRLLRETRISLKDNDENSNNRQQEASYIEQIKQLKYDLEEQSIYTRVGELFLTQLQDTPELKALLSELETNRSIGLQKFSNTGHNSREETNVHNIFSNRSQISNFNEMSEVENDRKAIS